MPHFVVGKLLKKPFEEIAFFKSKGIQKINVLDPIFNVGDRPCKILSEIKRVGLNAKISLQCRFENLVDTQQGKKFLELCADMNVHLEFGLQTAIASESEVVNRKNKIDKVAKAMLMLKEYGISYEVSLIYGLPTQTVESFQRSIAFVHENKCAYITAFPLMLLKGTNLYAEKEKWGMQENILGDFNIPLVTCINSFTYDNWLSMKEIAESLEGNKRFM